MSAGIGKILACLHPHVGWLGDKGAPDPQPLLGAIAFCFARNRWGTGLMLHSDLDPETAGRWLHTDSGSAYSARTLRDETRLRILAEAKRRHDTVHHADYVLECRAMDLQAGVIRNRIGMRIVNDARHQLAQAQEDDWPRAAVPVLMRCADSVLQEFGEDDRCEHCDATGIMPHVLDENRQPVPCPHCKGLTYTRWSDRQRATSIEVTRRAYHEKWRRPYEWLYSEAMRARRAAVKLLRYQLKEIVL